MKLQINFKKINPDYNQEYADEYHFGKESESNWKYTWAAGYELKNVESIEILNHEPYQLKGAFADKAKFLFSIPNVCILRCKLKDGNVEDFAVSKSILKNTHQVYRKTSDTTDFYFYLNEEPASVQLRSNLVVDERDVPETYSNLKG